MDYLKELSIQYTDQTILVLDQKKLPFEEEWVTCNTPEEMVALIKDLSIRGAPLIGVGAMLMLAKLCTAKKNKEDVHSALQLLKNSRPTAVNLMNYLQILEDILNHDTKWQQTMVEKIYLLLEQEKVKSQKMSALGSSLINDQDRVLTHCNSGSLATIGEGTALGSIKHAFKQQKDIFVWVDETRPLLQGARLTAWELEQINCPYKLICDNMSASLMAQKKIDKIFVGADRIALNGDFANKIGTYSLAVLAYHHKIPFYVVAPTSTIDQNLSNGEGIPIEHRNSQEVCGVYTGSTEVNWAEPTTPCYNPAFDITPSNLVTGWIFDTGIYNQQQIKEGIQLCGLL